MVNNPNIRFAGFADEWEERKLEKVFDTITDYVANGSFESLRKNVNSSDINGFAYLVRLQDASNNWQGPWLYTDQHGYEFLKKSRLQPDDIIMANVGSVGKFFLVPKLDKPMTLAPNAVLIKSSENDQGFLYQMMLTPEMQYKIFEKTTPGVQSKINKTDFKMIETRLPNMDEQKKIGAFFKQLDDTIALHQRKLDLLKEQKKGFLQKMFPKNGATVPEWRFVGFADAWEERKLSSMTNYKNGKGHEDKQSTSGKLELINLNSISISGGLKHSGKFIDEADDTLQKDDLVMILSDVGHGDLLGRVALIPEDDRFVLNQRVALLRPNITADPQFLFSYINAHQYYFKAQGAGMSQLNISKGSVENFISFVPTIEEQEKIGSFFKQLDDTIARHQRKLDLLKDLKKGLSQQMFV